MLQQRVKSGNLTIDTTFFSEFSTENLQCVVPLCCVKELKRSFFTFLSNDPDNVRHVQIQPAGAWTHSEILLIKSSCMQINKCFSISSATYIARQLKRNQIRKVLAILRFQLPHDN